jgi:isopentenyl phosphate kinase
MFVIKFGGSVITDKKTKYTFSHKRCSQLVSEVRESAKKTLIIHGAGSFGHILAKEFALNQGYLNEKQIPAIARVQKDVKDLNLKVLNTFIEAGIPAVSLAPSAFLVHKNKEISGMDMELFKRYYKLGLTPISFGDVVLDDTLKFSICSGDQLMLEFARAFLPETVIFVADVDGIFSSDPASSDDSELIPVLDQNMLGKIGKGESMVDDVTGSIFGKLDHMFKIADLGVKTIIINGTSENRLRDALLGENVISTKIVSKKAEELQ